MAYGHIHSSLAVYLDLKLSEKQPAFVEGGEKQLLRILAGALEHVETVKEKHGLGVGRIQGGVR
jgi:hypothetical protein